MPLTTGTDVIPLDGYVARVKVTGLLNHEGADYEYLFAPNASQRSGICIDSAKTLPAGCWGWSTPRVAKSMFGKYAKSRGVFGWKWEYLETLVVDRRGHIRKEREQ